MTSGERKRTVAVKQGEHRDRGSRVYVDVMALIMLTRFGMSQESDWKTEPKRVIVPY